MSRAMCGRGHDIGTAELRKIIHVDMDAFFAAIEQRDNPALRGQPIAVGSAKGRGVVMTASYEARPAGVRSAMPSARALRLCPELLFVQPRFEVYRGESRRIRAIFQLFTDLVEPASLDEAYLDVTEPKIGRMPAAEIAARIKAAILAETGLTASAGVSFNKFLAKTASGLRKPDGLTVIRPERAPAFLAALPIEQFHGVGPATARRMRQCGISSGADLQARGEPALVALFGRMGAHYWRVATGRDDRPVTPDQPRRSISVETTFRSDLTADADLRDALAPLVKDLADRVARAQFLARTLTLKIRFADFSLATRRSTDRRPFRSPEHILSAALGLLERRPKRGTPIRLLGVGLSATIEAEEFRQLGLPILVDGGGFS
ncbi:MAG: DNA polymerase IV [Geminicoccaceae bacterium]